CKLAAVWTSVVGRALAASQQRFARRAALQVSRFRIKFAQRRQAPTPFVRRPVRAFSILGRRTFGVAAAWALPTGSLPMTVKAILSRKGRDVMTIAPTASLSEAVKLLAERRIGAVVVTGADNRVAGILSERDIVRTLAARGAAALDDNVAAVMTRK